MKSIPTAKEYLRERYSERDLTSFQDNVEALQEFAKLHVEQALEAAHINMQLPQEDLDFTLSSYPLENIK